MAITPLPTPPSRETPSTFSALADAFLAALPTFATECNAAAIALDLNAVSDTSTTSLAISVASKSLTVSASKGFLAGMSVKIARTSSPSNWMVGDVTSYNSGTGAMVVNVTHVSGSGTYTDWTVTQCAPVAGVYVPLGFVSTLETVNKSDTEITITGFTIEINGVAYTLNASLDKTVSSLSASTWYYLFAQAPSGGTTMAETEITYSSTAPAYDHAKCGWYDAGGTKRCFSVFYSDGDSDVWPLKQVGRECLLIDTIAFLSTATPATSYTLVDTNVPNLGAMIVEVFGKSVSNSAGSGRTGYMQSPGQLNTDDYNVIGLDISNGASTAVYFPVSGATTRRLFTNSSGEIYYYLAAGYSCTSYQLFLRSFILPKGF